VGLAAKLRYRFDLTLSRGSGALILWLALVTLGFVMVTGLILQLVAKLVDDGKNESIAQDAAQYVESSWDALMRTLDPGTVTGDETWPYRIAALAITIGGIFIFSTLIGLIASVIDRQIENLRKGRGIVVEEGHTLILGWSEKLHTVVSELQEASLNQHKSCIVVMADRDRVGMEDELNARFGGNFALDLLTGRSALGVVRELTRRGGSGKTRIVCRSGNPADPADLAITSPMSAKSIIVLSEDRSSADAQTIKTLLALMSFDRGLAHMQVTIELAERDTAEAIDQATAGNARTIVTGDLMSMITAQICRQAGMGAVYQELFDFAGDEIYFTPVRELAAKTYGAALMSFGTSSVIGIRSSDGDITLNPPMDTILVDEDQLIAISEDDDTLTIDEIDTWSPADLASTSGMRSAQALPDHILLAGWNANASSVVQHIARAAAPGSTLTILASDEFAGPNPDDLSVYENLQVEMRVGDTTRIEPLARALGEREFERLVLLGYRDELPSAEADARTLLTLVHARRILDDPGHMNTGASLVAELVDARSVTLGQVANPDDFVVSERLTSLVIAQLAENGELHGVFRELLDGDGVEIRMHPMGQYILTPAVPAKDDVADAASQVTWGDVVGRARQRGESAIGYVMPEHGHEEGVRVNPAKDEVIHPERIASIIVVG
jgi:hypothetical protein